MGPGGGGDEGPAGERWPGGPLMISLPPGRVTREACPPSPPPLTA